MADAMVLAAQKWVNATYAGRTGYKACAENGKTGWAVMWSLTRALQIELGMNQFADSVGPATMAAIEAHGSIGPSESNTNIIKIVQAACFCKGYHAGAIDGTWGAGGISASGAIASMMGNIGLPPAVPIVLRPKVFKALLTMDAYVLVNGGSEEVRTIQQWLNKRYWLRPWYYLAPCDGHYSRDVQKALVRALQAEFGFPDSSITGNFGDATKTGLRNHPLQTGDSGIFVQLLSAACVFNGGVPKLHGGSPTKTVFKETFDSRLSEYLEEFQAFALLPVTGDADYSTWCELLVSMGDPDRPATACDTSRTVTASRASSLRAAGYEVVGRYLENSPQGTLDKKIKPGEIAGIHGAGMRLFPIWQYNSRELADFTYDQGRAEGALAHDRMSYYGFQPGSIIYFAVDYDATDTDINSNIVPYFQGVQSAMLSKGRKYRVGVYGSRNVCSQVSSGGRAVSSFVSGMSYGFSGNLGFPLPFNWAFNQIKEIAFPSGAETFPLDRDVHRSAIDKGIGPENLTANEPTPASVLEICDFIDEVYQIAQAYQDPTLGTVDPNLLTLQFLRSPAYTNDYGGWEVLLERWNEGFINHAGQQLETSPGRLLQFKRFLDPVSNVRIGIDHLAAVANGSYEKDNGVGNAVGNGDFAGWGGDLATAYCDWRASDGTYPSGRAFANARIGLAGVESSWGFEDMIQDADGLLIGQACRSGSTFPVAFRNYYTGGGAANRFSGFYQKRFNSQRDTMVAAGRAMLVSWENTTVATLRRALFVKTLGVFHLPPEDLDEADLTNFLDGIHDRIADLASL